MTISADVQDTVLPAAIELFIVDLTPTGLSTNKLYFTPSSTDPIQFSGQTYSFLPIQITGAQISSQQQASPKLALSNVELSQVNNLINFQDMLGASVTYICTFETYLNNSNGSERFSERTYYINAKTKQNKTVIEFSLGTLLDRDSLKIPRRRATQDVIAGMGLVN